MKYIKVFWAHNHEEEPEWLYSEIDSAGTEVRKVETFKDGTMGFASSSSKHRSKLAECEMPSLSEIAEDPQFKPEEISMEDFQQVWEESQRGHK